MYLDGNVFQVLLQILHSVVHGAFLGFWGTHCQYVMANCVYILHKHKKYYIPHSIFRFANIDLSLLCLYLWLTKDLSSLKI